MRTRVETGLVWQKTKWGSYCGAWPNDGMHIERSADGRWWEFKAWHPRYFQRVTVHSARSFGECERAAEIWMAQG